MVVMPHSRKPRRMPATGKASSSRKVSVSTKKYVKSQISRKNETKFNYTGFVLAQALNTFTWHDLSVIPQGQTNEQRIGDKVDIISLSIGLRALSSTATQLGSLRFILVSTRVEGTPNATEIIKNTSMPQNMISRYVDGPKRHHVLYDQLINLTTPVGAEAKERYWDVFRRKDLGSLTFDSAGATTAPNHKLWLGVVSGQSSLQPQFEIRALMKYKDG